jgi:ferredoxin-NADP reductase
LGFVSWRVATVAVLRDETRTARTITLSVEGWPGHLAGQHVDVRLTAEDGYAAVRSYSIASAAGTDDDRIDITVEELQDGEVSPFLARDLTVDDQFEVRGPIGGWFVWRHDQTEPVQLVAGGSGIVPVMAMLRTHRRHENGTDMRLLYSTRSPQTVIYRDELDGADVLYTRSAPADAVRPAHRLGSADVLTYALPAADSPTCYICGPTGFVEAAADLFLSAGHPVRLIRTERFGGGGL